MVETFSFICHLFSFPVFVPTDGQEHSSNYYAGVLEPEELTSIIEGVDRRGKHSLPRIQEDDLHRSTDSISTMESDSLTLESLEADLFEDIRASIQKSRIRPNVKTSKNSKTAAGEMEGRTIHHKLSTNYGLGKRQK